jgi:alpha-D-xyloside xylohydrolase
MRAPCAGLITATRVSDGAVLLQQVGLAWGPPAVGSRPNSSSVTVAFAGTPGELVYGLGEHRTGTVQQMPFFRLFQDVQYYPISHGGESMVSWYSSSRGYGFLWNLPSYGWVNLTNAQLAWHSNATMNADFWVTTLPPTSDPAVSPHALLLHNMVDVVGHAPAAPYYATGFIQCKDRYRNQTQLMDVARGYVSRGLPISTIVIDWQHWVNMGDWTLNPACWPDPVAMVAELTEMGIQCMITFWPFQTTPSQHWAQYAGGGLLATNLTGGLAPLEGDYFLYDATNPLARNTTFADWYAGAAALDAEAGSCMRPFPRTAAPTHAHS